MERHHETPDQFYAAIHGQIDPAAYAGEGFSATDEIARSDDVKDNPWLRGRVGEEESYWPGPKPQGRKP